MLQYFKSDNKIYSLLKISSLLFVFFMLYVGNLNSWKFHYYGCRWERRMCERNRYYTESRQELVEMGMRPCKVCRP